MNDPLGKRLRERKKGYAKKYEKQNGTPIFPFDHEYQLTGKKTKYGHAARGRLLQFPLRLNYAQTSHKMQVRLQNTKHFSYDIVNV